MWVSMDREEENRMSFFLHPPSSFHLNALEFHIFPGYPCLLCFIGIQHSVAGSEMRASL